MLGMPFHLREFNMTEEINPIGVETKKKFHLYDLKDGIEKEDLKLVLEILQETPGLLKPEKYGLDHGEMSPLHLACYAGNDRILEALLDYGADINEIYSDDIGSYFTPIELAQSLSCEDLLITRGINQVINEDVTLLHNAAYEGDVRKAALLLSRGAQMDIFAAAGLDFLHEIRVRLKSSPGLAYARLNGCFDEGSIGTDSKPLWDYPFGKGETVLHWAARGCPTAITSLCQAGSNINAVSSCGETPLHWAINAYEPATIKDLLELGANPDFADANGITPRKLFAEIAEEASEEVPENREEWDEVRHILDQIPKGSRMENV
jgi:ankyrin repeat protein